ncbi:hypothetical protein R9X47_06555 [Wukongibacter baidiensis]|uniref:hypothetical protein n=1 Tax=Wukongibacter baidiensis TaxID=1723361 RepID=UPI003D7F5919
MNNTKRSINFAIAFMAVISIFTFIVPTIDFQALGENTEIVFPNLLFLLFIVLFSSFQLLFRILTTSKYYVKDKLFFTLSMKSSKMKNRTIPYLGAIALFLWPVIVSKNISLIKLGTIINFLIWILVIEGLLYVTNKYTKIHFMSDGILIRGLDFRIDIPLGDSLLNHSGFYTYYDIQSYFIENNCLELVLFNDVGIIQGYISSDRVPPVSAFFESKEIRKAVK